MSTKTRSSESELIADLEQLLAIDETQLQAALQQQPDAYWRISETLALEESRRDALKQYHEEAEAHAYLDIKRQAAEEEIKLTEKELTAKVRVDPDVLEAVDKLLKKERTVAQLKALLEAFKQRKSALENLVTLFLQSYYGEPSDRGRADLRDRQYMDVRRRQTEQRNAARRRDH